MESSIVISHVTAAGVVVGLIQWLKASKYFPMITADKTKLLRILAVIGAALGAGGISYAWDPTHRILSFQIPTLAAIGGFLLAWVKSFVFQEITYQATNKNGTASLLKQILAAVSAGPNPAAAAIKQPNP